MAYTELYQAASVAKKGTLYQLIERFNHKNVKKDVRESVHASTEFIRFATYGYLIIAAMKILGIDNKDDSPLDIEEIRDGEERKEFIENLANEIVEAFVFKDEDGAQDKQVSSNEKGSFECVHDGCRKNSIPWLK